MIGKRIRHYVIQSPLGEGGMGAVYRAEDTELRRLVALKFLPPELTEDNPSMDRFLWEARAASALNHPNIVTIHEIGQDGENRFIVMELIDGDTLRSLMHPLPPVSAAIQWLSQLMRALTAAHQAGIIHRDIKPENIMVRHDGYLKLVDFGLARLTSRAEPEGESARGASAGGRRLDTMLDTTRDTNTGFAGTVPYMSPEQAQGLRLTPATDLFSVGVVFYELAAGSRPFAGRTAEERLASIITDSPRPPSHLRPELAGGFEDLILGLLEKDPAGRPTAAEALELLADLTGGAEPQRPRIDRPAARPVHLVGREREELTLRSAVERVGRAGSMLLCISGEAGIGKTALVDEFLQNLSEEGRIFRIARGQCSQRLSDAGAFLPLLDALDYLLAAAAGSSVRDTLQKQAPNWYQELIRSDARATSAERFKRELADFLREVSRRHPLILYLDDIHWSDASTIEALAYLASRFSEMRVLILVTYRPEDLLRTRHPFNEIKLELVARGMCQELPLGFLSRADIDAYLLETFPDHRFPPAFGALIHVKTEGNPLFVVDLVRYLRDRKVILEQNGHWALVDSVSRFATDVPASVRGMIDRKVALLGEQERQMLTVASVLGTSFDSEILSRILHLDIEDIEERLQILERVYGLIAFIEEKHYPDRTLTLRYRFVHALYQNTLYGQLTPRKRVAYSKAAAEAMLTLLGDHQAGAAAELAFLFGAANEFRIAAEYALTAARRALRVFANREAAELARRGLSFLSRLGAGESSVEQELVLNITLGVALMTTRGYGDREVEQAYTRAEELCQQVEDVRLHLFPVLWGLYVFSYVRARMPRARELVEQLLDLASRGKNKDILLEAQVADGIVRLTAGEPKQALKPLEDAMSAYDPARRGSHIELAGHDPGVLARCFGARSLWCLGFPDRALAMIREAVALGREVSHPYSLTFALAYAAIIHGARGEIDEALDQSDAALDLAREEGFDNFIARGTILREWALSHGVPGDGRARELRRAIDTLEQTGTEVTRSQNMTLLGDCLLRSGRVDDGLEVVEDAISWTEKTGVDDFTPELHRLRGALLLKRPRPRRADAEECFRTAIGVALEQDAKSWELRAATSLSELLLDSGNRLEAFETLGRTYFWFEEGFETADVRTAQALLRTLS